MKDTPQHDRHLDTEQLAAFAEGALPEHERLLALAHMAACTRCREIAFLTQEPVPAQAPRPERSAWEKLWNHPWLLGGSSALVASALLLGVFLRNRPETAHETAPMVAMEREQKVMPSPPPAMPARPSPAGASRRPPTPASPMPTVAERKQERSEVVTSAQVSAPPVPGARQPSVSGNTAAAPRSTSAGLMAKQTPPVSPAGQAPPAAPAMEAPSPQVADRVMGGFAQGRAENLPVNGRNAAALSLAGPREPAVGPLRLQIEHGAGVEDGKASLTGRVMDPSGAAIPKAVVRLTSPSPGEGGERTPAQTSAEAVTDASGRFALAAVPAGQYKAQVSAPGFLTVTQSVDLRSQDLARAETVLPLGSASESVEVNAANAEVLTEAPKLSRQVEKNADEDTLPGGLIPVTTIRVGPRVVALDTSGSVFTRREGRRWKRVKAPWAGAVAKLESSPGTTAAADTMTAEKKARGLVFQVTTSSGSVWISADGEHWTGK